MASKQLTTWHCHELITNDGAREWAIIYTLYDASVSIVIFYYNRDKDDLSCLSRNDASYPVARVYYTTAKKIGFKKIDKETRYDVIWLSRIRTNENYNNARSVPGTAAFRATQYGIFNNNTAKSLEIIQKFKDQPNETELYLYKYRDRD